MGSYAEKGSLSRNGKAGKTRASKSLHAGKMQIILSKVANRMPTGFKKVISIVIVFTFLQQGTISQARNLRPNSNCPMERSIWSSGSYKERIKVVYDPTVVAGHDKTIVAAGYKGTDIEFEGAVSKTLRFEKWLGSRRIWSTYGAQLCLKDLGPCYVSFATGTSDQSIETLIAEPTYKLDYPTTLIAPVSWAATLLTVVPDEKHPRYLVLADVGKIYYSAALIVHFHLPNGPEREDEQISLHRFDLPEVFTFAGCSRP